MRQPFLLAALALAATAHAGTLHVFTSDAAGFDTHSVWYDDGREVTVVDAQFTPGHAQALLDDIARQTASPVTRVIVTHPNPDKFNGLPVFHRRGIESIASTATAAAMPGVDAYKRHFWVQVAKAFTDATYPAFEPVKTTYSGQAVLHLKSGETITLFELAKPGVSSDQTVVRIDATGDLVVGDLVHTGHHAWLEGGIVKGRPVPTLDGWKADLAALRTLGRGKVYGGRGDAVPVDEAVARQTAYLDRADAIVDGYLRSLGERRRELSDPTKQPAHYAALQAVFAKEFPDCAGADFVGYSVYGLVQQKLGR